MIEIFEYCTQKQQKKLYKRADKPPTIYNMFGILKDRPSALEKGAYDGIEGPLLQLPTGFLADSITEDRYWKKIIIQIQ